MNLVESLREINGYRPFITYRRGNMTMTDTAIRARSLPVRIANTIVKAAADRQITTIAPLHILSFHAAVADDQGRSPADPRHIAEATGYGITTVYRSLSSLEEWGYITWDRSPNRKGGEAGMVRIIPTDLPDA
jgi:hypothetical protein